MTAINNLQNIYSYFDAKTSTNIEQYATLADIPATSKVKGQMYWITSLDQFYHYDDSTSSVVPFPAIHSITSTDTNVITTTNATENTTIRLATTPTFSNVILSGFDSGTLNPNVAVPKSYVDNMVQPYFIQSPVLLLQSADMVSLSPVGILWSSVGMSDWGYYTFSLTGGICIININVDIASGVNSGTSFYPMGINMPYISSGGAEFRFFAPINNKLMRVSCRGTAMNSSVSYEIGSVNQGASPDYLDSSGNLETKACLFPFRENSTTPIYGDQVQAQFSLCATITYPYTEIVYTL